MIDTLLAHIGVFSEGMRFSEENFEININSYVKFNSISDALKDELTKTNIVTVQLGLIVVSFLLLQSSYLSNTS